MGTLDDAYLFDKREKAMEKYEKLLAHIGRLEIYDQRIFQKVINKVWKKEKLNRTDVELIDELASTYGRYLI